MDLFEHTHTCIYIYIHTYTHISNDSFEIDFLQVAGDKRHEKTSTGDPSKLPKSLRLT